MISRIFLIIVCHLAAPLLATADPAKPDQVLQLWDTKPPGDFTAPGPETLTPPKPTDALPIARLTNVSAPRLDLYLPPATKANGAAVIIVPGGGFGILASEHEGSELATWLRDRGFVAAVLQHRCPTNKLPKPWELPAFDTQRALSLLRAHATAWKVQPDRIGLFGFSAGGQVALIATTNAAQRLYPAANPSTATMESRVVAQTGTVRSQERDFMSSIAVARMVLSSIAAASTRSRHMRVWRGQRGCNQCG